MAFTNINDPAGVQALLERLRASQAWQTITSASSSTAPTAETTIHPETSSQTGENGLQGDGLEVGSQQPPPQTSQTATSPTPATSVASLLSQLQASIPPSSSSTSSISTTRSGSSSTLGAPPYYPETVDSESFPEAPHPIPAAVPVTLSPSTFVASHGQRTGTPAEGWNGSPSGKTRDVRNLSFQQSLPILAQLADDREFRQTISIMREEQASLEKKLWEERNAILKSQEEKVKVAKTKAAMIGAGLTQFEADNMTNAFKRELSKFDAERVLPAWDGLLSKQQAALESLNVPGMFVTTSKSDRERQQRVVQVLAGFEEQ